MVTTASSSRCSRACSSSTPWTRFEHLAQEVVELHVADARRRARPVIAAAVRRLVPRQTPSSAST